MASRSLKDYKPKKPHVTRTGQGGVPGEVWDLRTDLIPAFESLEHEIDELVTILDKNTLLLQGKVRVNFTDPGLVISLDSIDPTQVNVSLNIAGNSSPSNIYVPGLDVSALSLGYFGYIASTGFVYPTDAQHVSKCLSVGCYDGNENTLLTAGLVSIVKFSNACPIPMPGYRIFLARGDDEPGNEAAGKVTTIAPSSGVVAEVGCVLAVNAAAFVANRTAQCLIRIQRIVKRAT